MKTRLIFMPAVAMALACASPLFAESFRCVKVCRVDGSAVVVDGEKNLTAKFSGPDIEFEVGDRVLLSIPLEEVGSWQLLEENGVPSLDAGSGLRISYEARTLVVSGLPDGGRLMIHSLSGVLMSDMTVSGVCTIDLSGYPAGVYVMTCGGKSVKIKTGI